MTETNGSSLWDQVVKNVNQAAQHGFQLHEQYWKNWTGFWTGLAPRPQGDWIDRFRRQQQLFSKTVTDLARKHGEVIDRQYQLATESLGAALRVTEARTADDYRRNSAQFCRKSVDCLREMSELQLDEFQAAVGKWSDVVTGAAE